MADQSKKPAITRNSGAEFYSPGKIEAEYDKIHNKPELPGVPPPSISTGSPVESVAAAVVREDSFDPSAPDVLQLIQGGRFKTPFTITLMRRDGQQVFRTDAGTKTEVSFKIAKETIREPSDLLRIKAGLDAGVYKPLNNITLEFQLMLYLAYTHDSLNKDTKEGS